jgi:methyl-accepting chemotaxis protein
MDQIATAMDSINQATVQTKTGTQQMAGTARDLNALAAQLAGVVEQYRLE